MDSKDNNKVIAFDTLFSSNHIQMMKILLPYLDNPMQKSMAVFIKFLELSYIIDYYKKHPYPLCGCAGKEPLPDFDKLCSELLPYCNEKEKKQMEQLMGFFQSMKMYQDLMHTMEMMKDFMPDSDMSKLFQGLGQMGDFFGTDGKSAEDQGKDGASSSFSGMAGFDMMSTLMNMLSPEQKEMFDLFGGNHHES